MSDQAILDMFNDMITARDQLAAEYENIVIEIPPGQPQIEYSELCDLSFLNTSSAAEILTFQPTAG